MPICGASGSVKKNIIRMETTTNRAYDFSPLCQRKSLPSKSSTPPPEAPKAVDSREDPSSVLWVTFEEYPRRVGPLFEKTAEDLLLFAAKLSGHTKEELLSASRKTELVMARVAWVNVIVSLFPSVTIEALGNKLKRNHTTVVNHRAVHKELIANSNLSKRALEYRNFLKKVRKNFPISKELRLQKEIVSKELQARKKISNSSMSDDGVLFLAIASMITGLTESEILSKKRASPHVYSRMATIIMLKRIHPEATVVGLGNIIGRDHTTILHLFEIHNQYAMPEYHETEDADILLYRKILGTMENVYRLCYLYSLFD